MAKLYLQRHFKSQWNEDNRFAGWTDGPLLKDSGEIVRIVADEIAQVDFQKGYTSTLFRNMNTVSKIYDLIPNKYPMFVHRNGGKMQKWGHYKNEDPREIQFFVTDELNERYYGELQGLNKQKIKEKYGELQVHQWRRGFDTPPIGGEDLKRVCKRVYPFYKKNIEKDLREGKNVLIVASQNSLRAVVKYIENISDDEISKLEFGFGSARKYEFIDGKYDRI